MNIVEATKKTDSNHAIRRKSNPSSLRLSPTDSTFLTMLLREGNVVMTRWEPTISELTADDWETVSINETGDYK